MDDRASPDRGPGAVGALGRPSLAIASMILGALLAISLYVLAFRSGTVRSLGSDSAGYVVQMRGASSGVFDFQGSRPGVAVTGAFLVGTGVTVAGSAPIVLSLTLAAVLGLAAAVALRLSYGLPAWAMGVVVLVVATWGGTARLASGYLANLLSLTLFLLALILALVRGPGPTSLAVVAVAVACFLSHPGLAPVYLAIAVGWWLACLVWPRSEDRQLLRSSEALATSAAFVFASVLVGAVLTGLLDLEPRDILDFTFARERFEERAAQFLHWLSPELTLTMVLAGLFVGLVRRSMRTPAAATRLGIVWLVISAAGLLVLAFFPAQPGHRTVLLGVPAPMLGGLLIAGGAQVLIENIRPAGRVRVVASSAVAVIALGVSVWVAVVALRPFEVRASASGGVGPSVSGSSDVAGYLRAVDPNRPVVMVANPRPGAPIRWKNRQNTVRALAPDDVFLRTLLYLGDERKLLKGLPTYRKAPGSEPFNAASSITWPEVREALPDHPIIVVIRRWVPTKAWNRVVGLAPDGMPDVAILRGPVPVGQVGPVDDTRLPLGEAAVRVTLLLLILGIVGGGWSAAAIRSRRSAVDVTALAPAFGLCVVVIIAMGVALVGVDPGDPMGLGAVGLVSAVGWILAARAELGLHRLSSSARRPNLPIIGSVSPAVWDLDEITPTSPLGTVSQWSRAAPR